MVEDQNQGHVINKRGPSADQAECRAFRTKLMPFRMAMKPTMTGKTVGSRPMISLSTPWRSSLVTTLCSVVAAAVVVS